jgi:hypothetical protein
LCAAANDIISLQYGNGIGFPGNQESAGNWPGRAKPAVNICNLYKVILEISSFGKEASGATRGIVHREKYDVFMDILQVTVMVSIGLQVLN